MYSLPGLSPALRSQSFTGSDVAPRHNYSFCKDASPKTSHLLVEEGEEIHVRGEVMKEWLCKGDSVEAKKK